MSWNSVGKSTVVPPGRRVSTAVLAVLTGLMLVVGSGADASPPSRPLLSSVPSTPGAVGAAGVAGVAAAAGDTHSLVVGDDGVVYGAGLNDGGQLTGTGNRPTLTALTGLPAGVRGMAVEAGEAHTLVLGDDGVVYGAGFNDAGQLTGSGDRATLTALTGLPAGVRGVVVAAGTYDSLVLGDDGVVYGAGVNDAGQLTGLSGDKATLTALTGLPAGVRGLAVAAGGHHSLVVGDDGVAYGTGLNFHGQLTGTGDRTTLTALTGLPPGVRGMAVAAGAYHSLVMGDDGVVYGAGHNDLGQLTGSGEFKTTLTALTGLPAGVRAVAVAADNGHTLVVGDDGVVYGTGHNDSGQLTGSGDKATLTALSGLPAGVRGVAVAAALFYSLVVGDDGVVYGTGFNGHGQLTGTGDRTTLTALTGLQTDATAPAVTLNPVTSPTGDPTPTFTGTGGRAIGDEPTATLRIWQGPDASGTPLHTYPGLTIDGSGNWTTTVPAADALPDGTYTARAAQNDTAGNTGQSSTYTFTVDTTAPLTAIDTGPVGTTNDPTPTFTFFSDDTGSTFECKVDGDIYGPCASPQTWTVLADGSHTFAVRATDTAGNRDPTPATRTFTVDTTAPRTALTKHPRKATFLRDAKFAFKSSEPGSTFRCKVDRKPWKTCTSPYQVEVRLGTHTFQVRAIDAVGNADPTPPVWKWTVKPRS